MLLTAGYNDPRYYYPHQLHFGSWVSEASCGSESCCLIKLSSTPFRLASGPIRFLLVKDGWVDVPWATLHVPLGSQTRLPSLTWHCALVASVGESRIGPIVSLIAGDYN